MHKITAEMQRN